MYDSRQIIFGGVAFGAIERYVAVAYNGAESYNQFAGTGQIAGISGNVAQVNGERTDVVAFGPHQARLNSAVARGAWLKPDATGRLIPANAGDFAIARAEKSGVLGEIIPVLVFPTKI